MIITVLLYCFLILLTPLLASIAYKKESLKDRIFFLILISILLSIIASLRGNAGTDTDLYRSAYDGENYFRWVDFEPGFMAVMNLFKACHFPFEIFLFFMSFITCFFTFLTINLERDVIDSTVATLVFITIGNYFVSFNVMRQAFASSITLFAMAIFIRENNKNNNIIAIGLILLAGLFHYPSLVCLVVILIRILIRNRKSRFIIAAVLILALFIISNRNLLATMIFKATKSQYYVGYLTRQTNSSSNIVSYILKNVIILLFSFLFFSSYNLYPRYYTYFVLMILGYIIGSLSTITNTQISRLGDYFTVFNCLILPYCCRQDLILGNKIYRAYNLNKLIICLSCIAIFVYNYILQGYGEIIPYGIL